MTNATMDQFIGGTMHLESTAQSAPCVICQHLIHPDDQNLCSCGEIICDGCPSYGCACVDDDPVIDPLRVQLRALAIERAGLRAEREFMGHNSLHLSSNPA